MDTGPNELLCQQLVEVLVGGEEDYQMVVEEGTGGEGGEDTAVDEEREDQMTWEGRMKGKEEGMGLGGEVREETEQHRMLVSTVGSKDTGENTVQNLRGATTVEILGILPDNVHLMDRNKLDFQWCKKKDSIQEKGMKMVKNLPT
jgi:hypothetical protein